MQQPGTDPESLSYELRVAASPEIVFAHFTDPERMTRWLGESATLDPRPGGVFELTFDPEHTAVGEFTEVEEPKRVSFTWGWRGEDVVPPGSSTVSVTLEPDGEETVVRLVHSGLPEGSRESHDQGWNRFVPALATAIEEG